MNKRKIKKVASIMLIIGLLLGVNGNIKWTYATSHTEENKDVSTMDIEESEQVQSSEIEKDATLLEESVSDVESEVLITALDESGFTTETGAIALPTDDLSTIEAGKLYQISTFAQWIALSEYSKNHDLSGYRFCYILNMSSGSGSTTYDFTSQDGFTGLGSEEYPFAGELFANYAVGNITLKLNKSLFSYLSSKATIRNIQIQASSISGGLAEYLVAEESDLVAEYSYLTINNAVNTANSNVYSSTGCVGGLFAHVNNSTGKTLKITGSDVAVNAFVVGATAGGLIGELEGNTELCLTDFKLPTYVSGATNTSGAVGVLVGSIEGNEDNKVTVTVTSDSSITYKRAGTAFLSGAQTEYSGGLFGYIKNAEIQVDAQIKYDGVSTIYGIIGKNAGCFAGYIENSNIVFNKQFECYNVVITTISNTDYSQSGIGMFAGVLKNSTINIGDTLKASTEPAIIIDRPTNGNYSMFNYNKSKDQQYNFGGLIGYAYNSDLNFTENNPCNIKNYVTGYTNGNIGGIVGCYEVADGHNGVIQNIEVNDTRIISYDGTTGGLVGYVKMNDGNVTLSDCIYDGELRFAIQNTDAVMSTGVAKVEAVGDTADKLTLENIQCNSKLISELPDFTFETYGCAIGIADADFEIMGTENVFDHSGDMLSVGTNSGNIVNYYGGLVGEIKNSGNTTRKASVQNVYVGVSKMPMVKEAYGGLFGKVEENSAVSLDGTINAAGATTESGVSVAEQTACIMSGSTEYIGSIAGEADNALLYMEPETVFSKSTAYECDEIGNYGGVIRNGYWDAQSETEQGSLLIENYQVNGTLSETLATTGDLIRFAIAMNTEGFFMPVGNQAEGASIGDIDTVRSTAYTLSQQSYDLTDSGVMCLGRNDDEGITNYFFEGSFTGIADKSVITYAITSYNQKNIGLFPFIEGGERVSAFKNLDLQYTLQYNSQKATNAYGATITTYPESEYLGGLAAFAKGNITVNNVSYTGTITDVANVQTASDGSYIEKTDDYMGGFFGSYIGESGKTLTMNQLETNMTFTYSDFTHVLGGVIGYVDLDGIPDAETCDVQIENVKLGGSITFAVKAEKTFRESSFITLIGNQEKTGSQYISKCNIGINNLEVNGVTQKMGTDCYASDEMGGFLGYNWMDVNVELSNTQIGNEEEARIEARGAFGGLVHTVCGKMVIKDLTIGANTSFSTKWRAAADQCGLLVRNGQYLYLDIRDYTVESGVKLENYVGAYFDELVGFTKGGDDSKHGGIVSIGSSSKDTYYLGRQNPDDSTIYQSYQSGHVTSTSGSNIKKNPNTRYYYDLDKLQLPSDNDYATLDSQDDVMTWHLLHYANESIRKCIDENYTSLPASYTITGAIDMTAYSIYPTPVSNESYTASDDGTIIFNAEQIIAGENLMTATGNQKKYPEESDYQHYQMHAGLFGDVSGITVDGLKLSGNYSKSASAAGALVAGSVYGIEEGLDSSGKMKYDTDIKNTFSNVILDDLWCVSKDTLSYDAPIGLMIADISSGANVTFDGISMTGYTDDDGEAGKNAASALIGNVGGTTATYITLTFQHMDIADAADGKSATDLNSSKQDEILAKASFIYSYDYEENCNGFYLFTYNDYVGGRITQTEGRKITLGQELGNNGESPNYAKEEYFDVDYPVGQVKDVTGITFDCNNYIPYVCVQNRLLLINPKAGSITEGCGTYEDPYIIESARQLISLYRYLYDDENFKDIFKLCQWEVNLTGDDSNLCDGENGHTAIQLCTDDEDYTEYCANLCKPLLSKAYYQIVSDIDLSEYPEFTGFGRTDSPFDGVFVGKKTEDGTYPTIIMSKIGSTASLSDYGFIQYAKGCVVKDLCIQFNEPVMINKTIVSDEEEDGTIDQGGTGAGVIATVLGGENIIDNVTVKGETIEKDDGSTVYVECFTPKNKKAIIGGYVGAVNLGGVILRNMTEDSLKNFSVSLVGNDGLDNYLYTCGIVGRVYDGYVVYDDGNNTETPLFKDLTGVYANSYWEIVDMESDGQSRSYDIINGTYLQSCKDNGIEWTTADGYTISNAAQLQIISMALNAGMLNYDSKAAGYGYDYYSRQRSGNYDYVGNVGSDEDSTNARAGVIKYDNLNKAPDMVYGGYLSQYFSWDESSIIELGENKTMFDGSYGCAVAVLNPYDSVITYSLTGTEYDMSVYGSAFRGLGARYSGNEEVSPLYWNGKNEFHGNLIGNEGTPANIKLGMMVDGIQNVANVALLNNIERSSSSSVQNIQIANITLSGVVENKTDVGTDFTYADTDYNAGGFVSFLKNVKVDFKNVKLDQLKVKSQNYAGGMVAWNCKSSSVTADVSVAFENCGITSSANSPTTHDNEIIGMSVTGGLVGRAQIGATVEGISCLEHLYVGSGDVVESDGEKKEGESAGGLIGRAEGSLSINGVSDTITTIPVGNDITVQSAGKHVQIGGLVGCANIASMNYSFSNITLQNLTVENIYSGTYDSQVKSEGTDGIDIIGTAGIIGSATATISMSNITVGSEDGNSKVVVQNTNETIPNHSCYGNGGLVGRLMADSTLTFENCSVLGALKDEEYTTVISGRGNSGGIAGNSNTVNGENITVKGVSIESARYTGGFFGYHEHKKDCALSDILVDNVHIALVGYYSDQGDIGGIVGKGTGRISLENAKVNALTIDSDYCKNAGGFVGNMPRYDSNGWLAIGGTDNTVSNSLICGIKAGGVVGTLGGCSSEIKTYSNITVTNNKLIASQEKTNDTSLYTNYAAAGGFAGELGTTASSTAPDCVYVETLKIEDNLIACYDTKNQPARLGGVIGKNYSESYFYDVELADNYIGMMKQEELLEGTDEEAIKLRKQFLADTPISADSGLNSYLYFVTDTNVDGTYEVCTDKIASTTVDSEKFYQYAYLQGTFVGNVGAGYGLTKFINVHVDYEDSSYRPVSDVGLSSTNSLSSNSDMYAAYRKLCAIVYDGELENDVTKSIADVFADMQITLDSNMSNTDVPYIFENLESIWDNYQTGDKRTAYRLEENYQGSRAIDQDSTVENYSNLTFENIYQNTYKDGDTYKSPFKIGEQTIPMIVYNSAECGSLDQVVQTYINMLTNNSGALNSYVNSTKRSNNINVLGVNTYKMELADGTLSIANTGQSVTVKKRTDDSRKYEFSAVDGDELTQDGSSGTFTLIRITYGRQMTGVGWTTKYTLDIPVYVEKRLKIYSNMKMVEGIQYDIDVIKNKGQHVLSDAANKTSMTLPRGNSYSIYAEYIYADALDKFDSLTIPKLFYIDADNADISFAVGTKITMLALDEQSKPYYYTVTESSTKQTQIDFSEFEDADGTKYALKDIKEEDANKQTSYTDLCGTEYEDVVLERYVLLVDTSDVTENRNNAYYEMHISPKELWTNGSNHYQVALSSRTDYNEHCYELVNEIDGVTYEINTQTEEGNVYPNTYLDETSKISKGGSVKAHLQYDITADSTYWDSMDSDEENKTYVDIGFYLAVQDGDKYQKVPLPENTIILFGNGENTTSIAAGKGQTTTYYYQNRNSGLESNEQQYICINDLKQNTSEQLDITFDFSNADMSDFEQYNDRSFFVVAELVVTSDKELPAAGEVKDSYSMKVDAEAETDIGFALEVNDLMTLGMNQYAPANSDSGVVPYTASIAFPTDNISNVEGKFYTIVYQIEEKVSQEDETSSGPEYKSYTGEDVSLYLGTFENQEDAKNAVNNSNDTVSSGKGITAVTYQFSTSNIKDGADLQDGQIPVADSADKTSGVIKTHCTLVANCSNLNMTNYRVRAYLIVSDTVPNISGNYISNAGTENASDSCLNGYILRTTAWSALSEDIISEDLKNDFFIFTVAKIKTSMQ